MNIRPLIKKFAAITLLVIFFFLLHTSVFARWKLGGVCPNILVILTSSFGFMRGRREGMTVGLVCGLLLDSFYPLYFGMYSLIFLFLGYMNGFFSKIFYGDDVKLPMLLVGTSDFLYGCAIYAFMFLLRQRYDFTFYLLHIILPEVMYTVLVSLLLYFPLYKVDEWLRKEEKRSAHVV